MARNRLRAKGRRESGSFVSIPHDCLNHSNYTRLSAYAVKLLLDLCAQFRGTNNGDFTAAWRHMKARGWKSKATVARAMRELKLAGWVMQTRQGGRNQCSLYAVTFKPIDSCGGKLDIRGTNTAPGNWKRAPESLETVPRLAGQSAPAAGSMTQNR